jgi:nucleoside-diphosphate-sugar epimerase
VDVEAVARDALREVEDVPRDAAVERLRGDQERSARPRHGAASYADYIAAMPAGLRVLVTGHGGYVGAVTTAVLAGRGHEVAGLDTGFYAGCDLGRNLRAVDVHLHHLIELRRDLRDVEPSDVEGFDAVVHLAGLSNDPLGDLDPGLTRRINVEGSLRLAEACRTAGVERFVFASSCSMYGAAGGEAPLDETAPLAPLTAYAESKVAVERGLLDLAGDRFSPVLMRNATVYGVSPRLRVDLVLNNLVAWAHTTGKVRILSDGTPWRPLVHVRDVAAATATLLEAPRGLVHAEAFNVGRDGENHRVSELAAIVRDAVPGSEIEYAGSGDPDPRSYRVDFGKLARAFPELRLEWDARRGADELAAAYRDAGLTLADLEGDRFVRLRRLRTLLGDGALDADLRWRRA